MPAPLPIRPDRDPADLRRLARRERDGRVSARLLALANALDGLPREEAARLAGMTGQTLGDGSTATTPKGSRACATGPVPADPAPWTRGGRPRSRRWSCAARTCGATAAWPGAPATCRALVEARFGVRYRESGMLKLLEGLDLSWRKTRPVHPEADPRAQERFKKACPA